MMIHHVLSKSNKSVAYWKSGVLHSYVLHSNASVAASNTQPTEVENAPRCHQVIGVDHDHVVTPVLFREREYWSGWRRHFSPQWFLYSIIILQVYFVPSLLNFHFDTDYNYSRTWSNYNRCHNEIEGPDEYD